MSAIQFHADQAHVARQLADSSMARARAIRASLVAKLRRLYESDHDRSASSAFVVDEATTLALEGLLGNPTPLTDDKSTFLIDQLLLHTDPTIFDGDRPSTSASRAALSGTVRPLPDRSASSSPIEIVDAEPAPPIVPRPVTPRDEESDEDSDDVEEDPDSGKRRAESDYPSGDDSSSDEEGGGYQD